MSKREQFLEEMEQSIPWAELQGLIEPHYPKGETGRPPVGLSIMLGVYFFSSGSTCRIRRGRGVVRIARAAALCRGGLGTGAGTGRGGVFAVPPSASETRSGRRAVANGE